MVDDNNTNECQKNIEPITMILYFDAPNFNVLTF